MTAWSALFTIEIKLIWRLRVAAATTLAVMGYALLILIAQTLINPEALSFLIYSDPAVLGLVFTGTISLFEREQRVHLALSLSPAMSLARVIARTGALTLLAVVASSIIALIFAANIYWPGFISATFLISMTFSAIGITLACKASSITSFVALTGLVAIPTSASAILAFGEEPALTLIPTSAQLALLANSMGVPIATHSLSRMHWIVAVLAALVALWIAAQAAHGRSNA